MTWSEFKARVEAAGVKDDDQINTIDISSAWPMEFEQALDGGWNIFYAEDDDR